jgi:RNA polymerase sigma factor (sigma-70 family)
VSVIGGRESARRDSERRGFRLRAVASFRRSGVRSEPSLAWAERSARLYQELRRPARAMIRRAFRRAFDDDEVEDIYSNAWLGTLRALARRHEGLSDEEIRKYVLAAVANHASKELRRRSRRPTTTLEAVHAVADDGLPPDERAAKLEHGRLTRDLLSTLPPRRRAVMLLRYGWGLEPRHVCRLVKGLSPRAYRKEITRGVEELTEKLRLVEKGEWCSDREPVLKAYAAGLANPDQERQAQQHLSHCRHCTEFVAKLSGHLHDVGASVALPTAAGVIRDGQLSLSDRIGDAVHRIREQAAGVLGGRVGDGAPDGVVQAASASGSGRGAGAAGTGVLAKLAGLGTAGKLATVCLGGGAAATACLAAGVLPSSLPSLRDGARTVRSQPAASHESGSPAAPSPVTPLRSQVEIQPSAPADSAPSEGAADQPPAPAPAAEPEPPAPPPIDPAAPPRQQEFGVASAAPSSSSAASSSSGGGSATQREFGP